MPAAIMARWQDIVRQKRTATLAKIPDQWMLAEETLAAAKEQRSIAGRFFESLLDDAASTITTSSNDTLLARMAGGELSAVSVVSAFCRRAAYAHQLSNCLLEIDFKAALARAYQLDTYFKTHGELVGPLHGLPYTMKDHWHVKGLDTSMGYVGWIGTQGGRSRTGVDDVESELVASLNALGAVLIAKTSLMQSTWNGETSNNILGYQWNPCNHHLSSGGSSGGEGALQALRGSAFGFGSDIGGSVSMPAASNGVFSLKPSHGRVSMDNIANSSAGQMTIPTVAGIYAQSVSDLRLVFKALLSSQPWLRDPEVLPLPYRGPSTVDTLPLALGLLASDSVAHPHPPVTRAIFTVAAALEKQKHEIIEWKAPGHEIAESLHSLITDADRRVDVGQRLELSGEPPMPTLGELANPISDPPVPVNEYYSAVLKVQEFRAEYAKYWNASQAETSTGRPVDGIVMPVMPHAAPRPGMIYHYGYSCIINLLDYCSVVIPVTRADKTVDRLDSEYEPMCQQDADTWEAYDPEIFHNSPVAVQIVCRRLEEEKLLAIAQIVYNALTTYNTA